MLRLDMTADKKVVNKWPSLRYSRAAAQTPGGPRRGPAPVGDPDAPEDGAGRSTRCGPSKVACGIVLGILVAIFLTGSVLLCLTNFFESMVRSGLAFQEGGSLLDSWKKPAMKPLIRVYVYNYTNSDEFLEGVEPKLRVQEVGPYAYRETLERINVRFHDNGTMSYNEKRTHVFDPTLSQGTELDTLIVPNLSFLGSVARVADQGFLGKMALNVMMMFTNPVAFEPVVARNFLFGYNNSFYLLAKGASALAGNGALPKLGLLSSRAGINNNNYTVWTGRDNVTRLDVVSRFNGRSALSAWEDDDCNRIDGSEGAFFNLDALLHRQPVYLFNAGICRRLKLEFKSETVVMDDIPALRYGPPDDFFHNALDNEDNRCYRHSSYSNHMPSGVFNNSPCAYGSPTFLSFPHFYLADPSLREVVDGIDPPDPEKHQMFFNIHPLLGMNLGAVSRIQINIMVRRASFVGEVQAFKDGMILPVAWIETNANDFPEETKRAIYHATFTLRAVEKGMMYAFPLITIIFILILVCVIVPCGSKRPKDPPFK